MADNDYYRISLANDWQLTDLYEFPHAYSQNYAFIYCLDSDRSLRDRARIDEAVASYPWGGGYSYVNIYTVFQNQVPAQERPLVRSIHKSSPGWLDLFLNIDVAIRVAKSVAVLAGSAAAATYAYKNIQKFLGEISVDRKKRQLQQLQITAAQAKALTSMSVEMAKYLGFKNLKELHERTGNPEISMKLLLAHYRRLAVLVEYEEKGKARLPIEIDYKEGS
jgi:hypothetical protein